MVWDENGIEREGGFISRRDTSSVFNRLVGGTLFPGEHHRADFAIAESDGAIELTMRSADGQANVEVSGSVSCAWPSTSIFQSVAESSEFFRAGALGYSVTRNPHRLDGLELLVNQWHVQPLAIAGVSLSYFNDRRQFPQGTVQFDHAYIMRDTEHQWRAVGDRML